MSSDSSVTVSTGSRVRQFGLYRTIDARTEEFLRLSKKRQIRQGCACAAVSTAITVTIVVIILLIYEYVIAAEWGATLNSSSTIDNTYMNDQPTANRLYRSYFGIDQDYYERMPLLVNAMQENSYIDPSLDVIPAKKVDKFNKANTKSSISGNLKSGNIKKTSPRPFHYTTTTSSPFSKTYGSRNWIEKYRNAQRLQNIRQIIKYLEKTINAKAGDLDTKTPNSHLAFSGIYVEPMVTEDQNKPNIELDLMQQGSMLTNVVRPNDYFTPLINYIPDNPGQVNLVADTLLKFSPYPNLRVKDTTSRKPLMFRRILNYNNNCKNNNNCKENISGEKYLNSDTENNNDKFSSTTDKSFSVMLNLFPLKSALSSDYRGRIFNRNSQASIEDIYLTTSRPIVKFKRKSTTPTSRRFLRKKPKVLIQNRIGKEKKLNDLDVSKNIEPMSDVGTKMIVHVQVYTPEATTKVDSEFNSLEPNLTESPPLYLSDTPVQLTSNQVEDFHVGSSGVIPVFDNTTPSTTSTESVHPFSDITIKAETPRTSPPDIFTFSHEDAKIPEQYLNYHTHENEMTTEITRKTTEENVRGNSNGVVEMLVIKLKNSLCNKTTTTELTTQGDKDFEGATTPWTYVPQINGHYRSMNPHSIDSHLLADFDNLSKRNDEMSVVKTPYTPTYFEIRRNYTRKNKDVD